MIYLLLFNTVTRAVFFSRLFYSFITSFTHRKTRDRGKTRKSKKKGERNRTAKSNSEIEREKIVALLTLFKLVCRTRTHIDTFIHTIVLPITMSVAILFAPLASIPTNGLHSLSIKCFIAKWCIAREQMQLINNSMQ